MKIRSFFLIIFSLLLLASCTVSKEQYGRFNETKYKTKTIKEGKELYLFWNNLPIKKLDKDMKVKHYQKISKRRFFDAVVFYGTLGIFSFYTVEIIVPDLGKKKGKGGTFKRL